MTSHRILGEKDVELNTLKDKLMISDKET